MKAVLGILTLSLFLSTSAKSQSIDREPDKQPVITVSGSAEIQVAPDRAVFHLEVSKLNKDLQISKRQNDEAVGKLLEVTRRFSVPAENVQTSDVSVEMKYETVRDAKIRLVDSSGEETGKRIFKGFEVSKLIKVQLTEISRLEDFFSEVLKTGLTEVKGVTFETSRIQEIRDKARQMAMKAAKEKAVAMTSAIGQSIGKAVRIVEGNFLDFGASSFTINRNNVSKEGQSSEPLASFAPGLIKVEATVSVNFILN